MTEKILYFFYDINNGLEVILLIWYSLSFFIEGSHMSSMSAPSRSVSEIPRFLEIDPELKYCEIAEINACEDEESQVCIRQVDPKTNKSLSEEWMPVKYAYILLSELPYLWNPSAREIVAMLVARVEELAPKNEFFDNERKKIGLNDSEDCSSLLPALYEYQQKTLGPLKGVKLYLGNKNWNEITPCYHFLCERKARFKGKKHYIPPTPDEFLRKIARGLVKGKTPYLITSFKITKFDIKQIFDSLLGDSADTVRARINETIKKIEQYAHEELGNQSIKIHQISILALVGEMMIPEFNYTDHREIYLKVCDTANDKINYVCLTPKLLPFSYLSRVVYRPPNRRIR